ncbi:MAG: NAD(P)-binding domain-containing protein [Candidatus Omnitrophica bacterium]|nr:NAD(P)-binding domain-containing protein [Candidatus Omnitrophota bacterium]
MNASASFSNRIRGFFVGPGSITDMGERYPLIDRRSQSSIRGLYVIGNIAGTPDIKAALNSGYDIAHHIAELPKCCRSGCEYQVVIIGAGPAGLNAALEFEKLGVKYLLLEAQEKNNTLKRFAADHEFFLAKTGEGKIKGDLWFGDCLAGDLVKRWEEFLSKKPMNLRDNEKVSDVKKREIFEVVTDKGVYHCARVIVAVGKLVWLTKLDVAEFKEKQGISRSQVETTSVPEDFCRKIGIEFENTWNWKRWVYLGMVSAAVAAFYLIKKVYPDAWVIGSRNMAGWYPFLYSIIVTVFGIKAILRYRDKIQTRKYLMLITCQVAFFCVIPELIFRDWRAYGLLYAWPLALGPSTIQGFLQDPAKFYFWWTLAGSFLILPIVVMFAGKKYCSWVCGCGGLAETLGDSWRHYSPKGPENIKREKAILWVLGFAAAATLLVGLGIDYWLGGIFQGTYNWIVDTFLIAIIPVSLYPFLGGKIWCRYWCPTAGFMHFLSGWFTKHKMGLYRIESNKHRCIACNQCSRYCEVGIDVRKFAIKGATIDNINSSCIGCGICISVCPTEALAFGTFTIVSHQSPPPSAIPIEGTSS